MAGKREAHFEPERRPRSSDRNRRSNREYYEEYIDQRGGRDYYDDYSGRDYYTRREPDYRSGRSGNNRRRKRGGMPRWQKAVIAVLSVIVAILLLLVVVVKVYLGRIGDLNHEDEDRIDASDETFENDNVGENTMEDHEVDWGTQEEGPVGVEEEEEDHVINILLIGCDSRSAGERGRSDSMILLSLNRETQQISMVSLLRDSYVQIPGYSNNKLNASYNFGGYPLLNETIELNYGIEIDYNVIVDFNGFSDIVDDLGGIDIKLTGAEAEYMMNDIYTNITGLRAGWNHLDGEAALCYARARHVSTGSESFDFGRTHRQRTVLMTIYNTLMSKSWDEILSILYTSIFPCIETDMSESEILTIGLEFYNMGIENIQSYRLPYDDEFKNENINGMAVLVLDWPSSRQYLQEWLYGSAPTTDE